MDPVFQRIGNAIYVLCHVPSQVPDCAAPLIGATGATVAERSGALEPKAPKPAIVNGLKVLSPKRGFVPNKGFEPKSGDVP